MPSISLRQNSGFRWHSSDGVFAKGYLFSAERLYSGSSLATYFSALRTAADFQQRLLCANGCFAVVAEVNGTTFAAVDKVRSMPLFYTQESEFAVTDTINIANVLSPRCDQVSLSAFMLAGYTVGNRTLVGDTMQLQAGQMLVRAPETLPSVAYYHRHCHQPSNSEGHFAEDLMTLSDSLFNRLIASCAGKQIAVPLSGGYDSRYIATMLKRLGQKNVLCYTYGRPTSFEVDVSRKVARALGFEWYFVEYDKGKWRDFADDRKYPIYASNMSSLPHVQEYIAVKELRKKGILADDAVVVPGFCGDLLGGSYIPEELALGRFDRLAGVGPLAYIWDHHFHLENPVRHRPEILQQIAAELDSCQPSTPSGFIGINEDFFIRHKVAKFVVNALRVYEYFGLEWRMPLWDDAFSRFWYSVPYTKRIGSVLYEDFLFKRVFEPYGVAFRKGGAAPIKQAIARSTVAMEVYLRLKPLLQWSWNSLFKPRNYRDCNGFDALSRVLQEKVVEKTIAANQENINSLYARFFVECMLSAG